MARARVAVDRARPRLIRSPSQLDTSAVVIDATGRRPNLGAIRLTSTPERPKCAYVISSLMPGAYGPLTLGWDALSVHLSSGSPTPAAKRVS